MPLQCYTATYLTLQAGLDQSFMRWTQLVGLVKFRSRINNQLVQLSARVHFQKIFNDHSKLKQKLESEKKELDVRMHELEKQEAKNENERKKLQGRLKRQSISEHSCLLKNFKFLMVVN